MTEFPHLTPEVMEWMGMDPDMAQHAVELAEGEVTDA